MDSGFATPCLEHGGFLLFLVSSTTKTTYSEHFLWGRDSAENKIMIAFFIASGSSDIGGCHSHAYKERVKKLTYKYL